MTARFPFREIAEGSRDTERLDWLARAGDVSISMLRDQPRDGEICVAHDLGHVGIGKTLREAIDDARNQEPRA